MEPRQIIDLQVLCESECKGLYHRISSKNALIYEIEDAIPFTIEINEKKAYIKVASNAFHDIIQTMPNDYWMYPDKVIIAAYVQFWALIDQIIDNQPQLFQGLKESPLIEDIAFLEILDDGQITEQAEEQFQKYFQYRLDAIFQSHVKKPFIEKNNSACFVLWHTKKSDFLNILPLSQAEA